MNTTSLNVHAIARNLSAHTMVSYTTKEVRFFAYFFFYFYGYFSQTPQRKFAIATT